MGPFQLQLVSLSAKARRAVGLNLGAHALTRASSSGLAYFHMTAVTRRFPVDHLSRPR